ncbi:MAG: histidine kinase dimerization/phosphoacceptor domain -containing protein [Candidatus Desulfatibia sp.]|uniref:histidine kinase dimerization/phosphoacceptor domain -containing protein n=1 Tax=Candidatus Desulfatibia sp. TaxID=3101189 RepID=UPI002F32013F
MKNSGKPPNTAKPFFLIFLPLLILATSIIAGFLFQELKSQKEILKTGEQRQVEMLRRMANDDVKGVISDLFYLAVNPVLHQMIETGQAAMRQKLGKVFLDFSKNSKLYDQVRFLDETGMERVRINFGQGHPYIVTDNKLQNKAKRYYFADAFGLEPGRVFVSPFDLNIERGQIERPLKPVIRFGTPVVHLNYRKRGIVLLNYFGAKLIENLNQTLSDTTGSFMLLNSGGYWLKGLSPEDEWGFMYKGRKDRTLAQRDTEAWNRISARDVGQFSNDHGIYTFATVWPLGHGMLSSTGSGEAFKASEFILSGKDFSWKIVTLISKKTLSERQTAILLHWLPIYVLVILLLAFVSLSLALAATHRKRAEDQTKASLREKEILLREIHHRVKNNMQVIISLLRLQADKIEDKTYADMFKEGEDRIRSMALIHEQLYQSKDFANIDFGEYIKSLAKALFTSHGVDTNRVRLNTEIKDASLDLENAIPCGLIINELVSNSLKHAFPQERKGNISVGFRLINKDEFEITVSDDGIGIPEELDLNNTDSMGWYLVRILVERQLDGKIEIIRKQGTQFHIQFKRTNYKSRI